MSEIVKHSVALKVERVVSALPGGLAFACLEIVADADLVVSSVALSAFDDVQLARLSRQWLKHLFDGLRLVAYVWRHDLQRSVMDTLDKIAVDNDLKSVFAHDLCTPCHRVLPALPEPLLKFVLPDWIALVAYKVFRP